MPYGNLQLHHPPPRCDLADRLRPSSPARSRIAGPARRQSLESAAIATVARICRYPIKGLSAQELPSVRLVAGEGVAQDRAFALARPGTAFDPAHPRWLPKRHFLMLMRDERLAALRVAYDETAERVAIRQDGAVVLAADLATAEGRDAVERFFEGFMGGALGGRPRLVRAPGHMFSDHATKYLSLINLATVHELERALGRPVDPLRFRGNLYVTGLPAWAELDWLGRTVAAGEVRCRAVERIERCAATNVDPVSAARDLNIPLALRQRWGHLDCGVMLQVTASGVLDAGAAIDAV